MTPSARCTWRTRRTTTPGSARRARRYTERSTSTSPWCRSGLAAAGLELLQRLFEQCSAVLVAAAFLHVREVGLVRLVARRVGWGLGLTAGGETAFRAVP